MGIAVQHDPEPERDLLQRTDHWPFIEAGIPAIELRVRLCARQPRARRSTANGIVTGYHKPQDDLDQPMDWQAAADFNRFFYALVERTANQRQAPAWLTGSTLAPKAK